jgi:hypothetical protein
MERCMHGMWILAFPFSLENTTSCHVPLASSDAVNRRLPPNFSSIPLECLKRRGTNPEKKTNFTR